jgi:flagellar basal-body rod protein FlgB
MRFDLDKLFGVHQQAMMVRSKRAELIANNLANADTPNFQARDIDFKEVLHQTQEKDDAGHLVTTHSGHISTGAQVGDLNADIMYRIPMQPSIDGNTVDTQMEKSNFTENAIQYQASVQFLGDKIKALKTALKGE